jgi:hypothetical protein
MGTAAPAHTVPPRPTAPAQRVRADTAPGRSGDDRVADAADLIAAVARRRPGDPVTLTVWRGPQRSRVAVKLGLTDVCALLTVLEGRVAAAGGDKGLFHQTEGATAVITFRRMEQPFAGYALEVSRKEKGKDGAEPVRLRIGLSEAEGCGLRQVLAAAVFHLCFYETTVFPADADSETL